MVVYSHIIAETNLFRGWYLSWPKAEMWDIEASPLLVCGCFFLLHTLRSPHFPKEGPLRPLIPLAPLLSGSFLGGGGGTQRKTALWPKDFLLPAEVFPPVQSQAGGLPKVSGGKS